MTFTDENVKEMIATGKPVVVDFGAPWCGPCKNLAPIIEELSEQYKEKAIIGTYNIDEDTDFCIEHRIMSVPTLLFFNHGEKTGVRLSGSQDKDTLVEKIEELIAG